MKLIPYDSLFIEQIRAIDASAAQALQFNGDVFLNTAVMAVQDDEEQVTAFGYISRGTLNYGVFSLYAEFGTDPSSPDAIEAAEAILTSLKTAFKRLRPEIPHKTVYLTAWAADDRPEYREFMEENGFRPYRSMVMLEAELKSGEGDNILTAVSPEGIEETVHIEEIPVSDPKARAMYLTANGKGFGYPDSEAGLIFRVKHWKARVYAVVRCTEEGKKEILSAVTVWPRRNGRCATEDIFCIPEYRRQHLTEGLLKFVHQKLREEGFLYAGMNAFAHNTEALSLYKKLGYKVTDRLTELVFG